MAKREIVETVMEVLLIGLAVVVISTLAYHAGGWLEEVIDTVHHAPRLAPGWCIYAATDATRPTVSNEEGSSVRPAKFLIYMPCQDAPGNDRFVVGDPRGG